MHFCAEYAKYVMNAVIPRTWPTCTQQIVLFQVVIVFVNPLIRLVSQMQHEHWDANGKKNRKMPAAYLLQN